MKVPLFLLLALGSTLAAFGQKSFGIKLYQNTDFFESEISSFDTRTKTTVQHVNFTRFSIAFNITTKKNFIHEVEVFIPEVQKNLDNVQFPMNYVLKESSNVEGQGSSISLRYEISKTLTNSDNRLKFNAGAGINPYYVLIEYLPTVSNIYFSSNQYYGAAINIVPRMLYDVNRHFCLELSVPLKVYDLRFDKWNVRNPAIPISQQTMTSHSSIFFESAYTIRLGLTYKFSN